VSPVHASCHRKETDSKKKSILFYSYADNVFAKNSTAKVRINSETTKKRASFLSKPALFEFVLIF
jgi:hypothetical protein